MRDHRTLQNLLALLLSFLALSAGQTGRLAEACRRIRAPAPILEQHKHYEFNARITENLFLLLLKRLEEIFVPPPSVELTIFFSVFSFSFYHSQFSLWHSRNSFFFGRQNCVVFGVCIESDLLIWIQFNANLILHEKQKTSKRTNCKKIEIILKAPRNVGEWTCAASKKKIAKSRNVIGYATVEFCIEKKKLILAFNLEFASACRSSFLSQ